MSGDHDLGYKQLFSHPELVRDLLAGFTAFDCFRTLAPSAFERVNASYVSERFSERHGDMVWRVHVSDQVLYVYLLLEFQSHAERWMALRMQVYVGLLYQDLAKRREFGPQGTLPPVLPLVFYNGTAPWTASAELRELVAAGPSGLDAFQASQRYLLIDQRSLDPAKLPQARNVVAELFRLELSDSADILIDVTTTLAAWLGGEEQSSLRRSIAAWIVNLQKREFGGVSFDDIEALLEGTTMGERFVRKYATWADAIEDKGMQRGLAQAREEAVEKLRFLLKRLLQQRFGDLPPLVVVRLDQAAEADLERWIERVVNAGTVEAVLDG
jgi:hypothetical protein